MQITRMHQNQYLRVLSRNPKSSHPELLKKAKSGLLQQKVTISLNKGNAMKLRSLAARNDVEVNEMTYKQLILKPYNTSEMMQC